MEINIDDLREGTILDKAIERADGTLILTKGTILTRGIIQRLSKLSNIRFAEDQSLNEVQETVDLNLRNATEDALNEFLKNPNNSNMQEIRENTRKIVEMIESSEELQYDLEAYLRQPNDGSSHSVRTSCFSILLAKMYNDSLRNSDKKFRINLNDIAVAAVLQDVGLIYKDKERIKEIKEIPNADVIERFLPGIKDTPLDEYDERYSTVYSYCAVAEMKGISSAAKLMILLSKEPETGKGCLKVPTEVNARRSDFLYGAKIINVCSVYDSSMKRTIDNKDSLEEVVSELGYDARNGIVNSEIQELLINRLKLYPIKTRVVLSTGEVAVVQESRVGQQDSYKPVVYTRPYPGRRIDLKETTNITIKSILSKEMFESLVKDQIQDMKRIVGVDETR